MHLPSLADVPISLAKLIPGRSLINRIATTVDNEDVRKRAVHVIKKLDQIEKLQQESDEGPTEGPNEGPTEGPTEGPNELSPSISSLTQ